MAKASVFWDLEPQREQSMNQYDQQQLQLMKEMLSLYKEGKIWFDIPFSNIAILVDKLEEIDDREWKRNVSSHCFHVEVIYALMLCAGRETLSEEDEQDVEETANVIEKLVDEKIKDENEKLLKSLEKPNLEIKMRAENLEDNWLMCPVCIDAWQSEAKVGMVMCPECKTVMHNPNYTKKSSWAVRILGLLLNK